MTTYHLASNGSYWQASWRDATGRRHRKSLGPKSKLTRRQAEAAVQQLIVDHTETPALREIPKSGQLGEWIDRYLEIRASELDPATLKIHRRTADLLISNREGSSGLFPDFTKITDICRQQATSWRIWLGLTMRESTVCKHVRAAKVIMNRAVAEGVAASHNFDHLKTTAPKVQVFDREVVPLRQVEAAIEGARSDDHLNSVEPMLMLAYFAGMRTSEITHLRWEHVDLETNQITVVPRGGKVTTKQRLRRVRIEPELWTWLTMNQQPKGTVCGLLEAGRHNMASDLLRQAVVMGGRHEAGDLHLTIQELRRTRATIWNNQYPAYVAAAWLGHSEATAVNNYVSIPADMYSHDNPKETASCDR